MNGFKLAGLVLVAGWAAGTVGQVVGARKAKKVIAEAKAAKGVAK